MMFANVFSAFKNLPTILVNISLRDFLDIAVIALLIYFIILFVKQTRSYFIIYIVLVLASISFLSQNLNLTLTREVFQQISTITAVVLAVAFQREIRRFFRWIISGRPILLDDLTITKTTADEIASALLFMAKKKIGGIFVFPDGQNLDDMIEGGQALDGKISSEIILSIFDTSSAGHDGAIIIDKNRIKMFGAHLPLARDYSDYRKAGTRHRAATGITEGTDAIAIVVSEERGVISIAKNGKLKEIKDENGLLKVLRQITNEKEEETKNFWYHFFLKDFKSKGAAVACSAVLWSVVTVETSIASKVYEVPLAFQLLPPQYEIDPSITDNTISVTLQGRNQDLANFDASKLDIKVDAKNFVVGEETIFISENMVSVPPYIQVVDLSPEEIKVPVRVKELKEPPTENPVESGVSEVLDKKIIN